MKFLEWIFKKLSERRNRNQLVSLVREGYAEMRAEDYEKARATFLQALEHRERLIELGLLEYVLTSLHGTWLWDEKYDEQIAFFSGYLSRYSSDAAARVARAAGLWYSGKLDEALDDYSRALELDPENILALSNRGQVLAEMGRDEEALAALDRALASLKIASAPDPNRRGFYNAIEAFVRRARGVAAGGLGRNEIAMDEFTSSIALCPENAWVYYSRAQLYDRLDSPKNASADYQLALEKKAPSLTPIQRGIATARLRDLTGAPTLH
jgi:tetratricopeptide (TPR) repeat protein